MVDRFYGYQYDTNPRKLSQANTPFRNKYSQNDRNSEYNKNVGNLSQAKMPNSARSTRTKTTENYQQRSKYDASNRAKTEVKKNTESSVRSRVKTKNDVKPKLKLVMYLITGFSILFAISYQNSLISASFNKKEQYKKEMEALSKTNQQLEVSIENSLNMNNIEQAAKEKLGMQKLSNNQKIYISLPKQDYVAPAVEEVIIEDEEMGFFNKLIKGFTTAIK